VELKQFLIMIRKKLILIITIPILVSIIVAIGSVLLIPPVYEASSTLYIITQNAVSEDELTYNELLKNQQLVKDYRELIKSKTIAKTVLDELKITDITPDELSKKITVNSKNDTRVLDIIVKDTDPVRSMQLANKICEVFVKKAINITKIDNISVVDSAEIPKTPVEPQPLLNTLLAFLISFFATVGSFYLYEILNETIKTSEDMGTYLELNVLGTIPTFDIK